MKKIVASIKLAPGNRGYFDPLTGINLSVSSNIGYVRECDDISNIRRDIKNGKIQIRGGQLPPSVSIEDKKPVKEVKKLDQEIVLPDMIEDEIIEVIKEQQVIQEIKPVASTIIIKDKKKTRKEQNSKKEIKETKEEKEDTNALVKIEKEQVVIEEEIAPIEEIKPEDGE